MRTAGALLAAATLMLIGCGTADGQPTLAEDGEAVIAAGADAGIEGGGDERPVEEVDDPTVISVTVDAPDGVELLGTAVIAIEDVSLADASSTEIARVEVPAADVADRTAVDLFVPVPLDGTIEVTATVHIDTDESGSVSPGDWISPELVPVGPDTTKVAVAIVLL